MRMGLGERSRVLTARRAAGSTAFVTKPEVSIASIADGERRTERSIRQTLSLAFLDPALVEAAMEGRLPRGFGLKRLMDLPPEWSQQWITLGVPQTVRR
jgi:site-specific DNA recombinase